ncbi:hypothetical protein Syun_000336 [Stephania yunnanensis]|uniref:Uncharacterized protein n=1 Tax=Stephania yunnanensis TaxID=152371 RepID=A0AAP0LC03_9MAGN
MKEGGWKVVHSFMPKRGKEGEVGHRWWWMVIGTLSVVVSHNGISNDSVHNGGDGGDQWWIVEFLDKSKSRVDFDLGKIKPPSSPAGRFTQILSVGIGGSALGPLKVVMSAFDPELFFELRNVGEDKGRYRSRNGLTEFAKKRETGLTCSAGVAPNRLLAKGFHTCVGTGGEKQTAEWYKEKGIEVDVTLSCYGCIYLQNCQLLDPFHASNPYASIEKAWLTLHIQCANCKEMFMTMFEDCLGGNASSSSKKAGIIDKLACHVQFDLKGKSESLKLIGRGEAIRAAGMHIYARAAAKGKRVQADSLEEAMDIVNKNKYSLSHAILTQMRKFQNDKEAGQVGINVLIPAHCHSSHLRDRRHPLRATSIST